jgi:lysine 2-monooxygenase
MSKTLKQLGVGAQTIADTAQFDYASFLRDRDGKDLGPLVTGTKGQTGLTVALIGGGIANVVAAYELARCGVKVTVFERAARLGGRLDSTTGSGDQPPPATEFGAYRFPEESRVFWHYVRAWARFRCEGTGQNPDLIEARLLPDAGANEQTTLLDYQNEWFSGTPQTRDRPAIVREAIEMWRSYLRGLHNGLPYPNTRYLPDIQQLTRAGFRDNERVRLFWRAMRRRFDHTSLGEVLRTEVFAARPYDLDNLVHAFGVLGGRGLGIRGLLEVSFLDVLRYVVWSPSDEYALPAKGDWTELDNGTSGLVNGLARLAHRESNQWNVRPFDDMFRLDSAVEQITADPDSGRVTIRLAGGRSETFDFAIVAMSSRAMQAIGLDRDRPGSPFHTSAQKHTYASQAAVQGIQAALHRLDLVPAVRMILPLPDPHEVPGWPKSEDGDAVVGLLTDRHARQTVVLPSVGLGSRTKAVVSALGNDALKFQMLALDQMHRSVAGSFDPQDATHVWPQRVVGETLRAAAAEAVDWNRRGGYGGGMKYDRPGGNYLSGALFYHYTLAMEPEIRPYTRVFLAGDSVALLGGCVEGALMSALNATTAVLSQIAKQAKASWQIRTADLLTPPAWQDFQWRRLGWPAPTLTRLKGTSLIPNGRDPLIPGTWRYERDGGEVCSLSQLAVSQDGTQMLGANPDGTLFHRKHTNGRWAGLLAMPKQLTGVKDVAITVAAPGPPDLPLSGEALVLVVAKDGKLLFRRRVDDRHWSDDWEPLAHPETGAWLTAKRCAIAVGGPKNRFDLEIAYVQENDQLWTTTRKANGDLTTPTPAPGPEGWNTLLVKEVAVATVFDDYTRATLYAMIDINQRVWLVQRTGQTYWYGATPIARPVSSTGQQLPARRVSIVASAVPGRGQLVLQCADYNLYHRRIDYNEPHSGAAWRRVPYPIAAPYEASDIALSRTATAPADPHDSVTVWAVSDLPPPR